MTLFVDASVLVAIAAREEGYEHLARRISDDGDPIWSAVVRWESIRALARLLRITIDEAAERADQLAGIYRMVAIGETEAALATTAHERFGKGNHPARLNMGDCFAWACAKAHGAKLLYKGDDFALTDLP